MAKTKILIEHDSETQKTRMEITGTNGDLCALLMVAGRVYEPFDDILETAATSISNETFKKIINQEAKLLIK